MPVRGLGWKYIRDKVIAERGRVCERCKRPVSPSSHLILHHIDGNLSNDFWENLALLCEDCDNWISGRSIHICGSCKIIIPEKSDYCYRCGAKWDGINRSVKKLGVTLPLSVLTWSMSAGELYAFYRLEFFPP